MKLIISLMTVSTLLSSALYGPVYVLSLAAGPQQASSTYAEVVDRAFQFSEGSSAEFKGIEARIVIRYLPSSSRPESQVVLLRENEKVTRVVQYNLKRGTPPITELYEKALKRKPSISVAEILGSVSVEKVEEKGNESVIKLVNEFLKLSIPTNLSSDLCMDGVTYELWVQTPSNEIHTSLSDCA